jgi:hypothetical protein
MYFEKLEILIRKTVLHYKFSVDSTFYVKPMLTPPKNRNKKRHVEEGRKGRILLLHHALDFLRRIIL